MTDLQLALYLRQLVHRIRALATEIEPYVHDTMRETGTREWLGAGPPDMIKNINPEKYNDSANWRTTEGRPVVISMIERFAAELAADADALLRE